MSYTDEYLIENRNKILRKTFNILVVDDDIDMANNFKILLEQRGHNVIVVDDGLRCITHCKNKNKKYNIVFIDYHMDGLDGTQVTEIIKTKDNLKTLVFAYTGDDSKKAINDFKQVGMDGAIIKPIDVKHIEILMSELENCSVLDSMMIKNLFKKSHGSIQIFENSLKIH